jgi:ABC-type transporter Mla maintaining outer membrane lipid asymmetry permease subunit MlaE
MEHHESTPMPAHNPTDPLVWPRVRSGPLVIGGVLTGIGAVVAIAGATVVGTHLLAATRAWVKGLPTPPGQLVS